MNRIFLQSKFVVAASRQHLIVTHLYMEAVGVVQGPNNSSIFLPINIQVAASRAHLNTIPPKFLFIDTHIACMTFIFCPAVVQRLFLWLPYHFLTWEEPFFSGKYLNAKYWIIWPLSCYRTYIKSSNSLVTLCFCDYPMHPANPTSLVAVWLT